MSIKIKEIHATETYHLRHQVMWPNKPQEFVMLDNDEEGIHFGLLKDSIIISVISLFIENNVAQFRKFATKISEQGNGYGSVLLTHVMNVVSKEKKIDKLWCNARVDKTLFYERFGMVQTTKKFSKGDIQYIIMEKNVS
ncbi:GNAT family N-acetyltransferase [uncultured Kordia sp.]|uniref:GNAT family N-acetyltransferase n=1 Tax=uncultured Kordia sp. TaxID=507699 RepID=UPI002623D220|nr:GNAT family N-acetyltransferase [uncultured Kordia sp.]